MLTDHYTSILPISAKSLSECNFKGYDDCCTHSIVKKVHANFYPLKVHQNLAIGKARCLHIICFTSINLGIPLLTPVMRWKITILANPLSQALYSFLIINY